MAERFGSTGGLAFSKEASQVAFFVVKAGLGTVSRGRNIPQFVAREAEVAWKGSSDPCRIRVVHQREPTA